MICKPSATRAGTSGTAGTDVFSFGEDDPQAQTLRNVMLVMTLPWAAAWALSAEMMAETLRRAGL